MKDIQRFIDDVRNEYGSAQDTTLYELTEDEAILVNALLDDIASYRRRVQESRKRYHHQLQINKKLRKENWEYHCLFERIKMEMQKTPKTGGKS